MVWDWAEDKFNLWNNGQTVGNMWEGGTRSCNQCCKSFSTNRLLWKRRASPLTLNVAWLDWQLSCKLRLPSLSAARICFLIVPSVDSPQVCHRTEFAEVGVGVCTCLCVHFLAWLSDSHIFLTLQCMFLPHQRKHSQHFFSLFSHTHSNLETTCSSNVIFLSFN